MKNAAENDYKRENDFMKPLIDRSKEISPLDGEMKGRAVIVYSVLVCHNRRC